MLDSYVLYLLVSVQQEEDFATNIDCLVTPCHSNLISAFVPLDISNANRLYSNVLLSRK